MLVNCFSKLDMLKKLESKVEGLDVTASSFQPFFSYIDSEGVLHNCQVAQTFVKEFNSQFGEILGKNTRTIGKRKFMLEFLETLSVKESPVEEDITIEGSIDSEGIELKDEKDTLSEENLVDMEFAKSLEEGVSKKEAKEALADYAQKFDIVLKKNKPFEDMLSDLKETSA